MDASKNENMALDLNGSWHDAIMLERGKCKKICYDMRSLKSLEKIRTRYGIPTDEKILAFCKGTLPLLGITEEGTGIRKDLIKESANRNPGNYCSVEKF